MEKLKKFAPYTFYAAAIFVFAAAEATLPLRPFALGFFMALVYSRRNVIILAPVYVAAALVFDFSAASAVYAAAPVVVALGASFLHYKLNRPMNIAALNAYVLLAAVPVFAFVSPTVESVLIAAATVVGNVLSANVAVIMLYAVSVRGLRYRLSPQEVASIMLFAAAVALSLQRLDIFGFPLLPMVAVPAVALSLFGGGVFPIVAGAVIGAGAAVGATDMALVGVYFLTGCGAAAGFKHPIFAALFTMGTFALGVFLQGIIEQYLFLVSAGIGVVIYLVSYRFASPFLSAVAAVQRKEQGGRFLINRTRLDVAQKLQNLSTVFADMEGTLKEGAEDAESSGSSRAIDGVRGETCARCPRKAECEAALGGDTSVAVADLISAAERRGKATILDTSPFLSSRCGNINLMIDSVNRWVERVKNRDAADKKQRGMEEMLSKQMGSVAGILGNLREDVEQPVSYDMKLEKKLIDELQYRDVRAVEAIVYKEKDGLSLTLIVASGDESKPQLLETVNRVLGTRMCENKRVQTIKGNVTLHFIKEPKYSVVYGSYGIPKSGEVSGDVSDAVSLGRGKVMLILSDGMGCGTKANKNSLLAVRMIEGFYKAGFSHDAVTDAASGLLTLRGGEEFNAVDLAVVDLETAETDFIKLGGREGYVLSGQTVEEVPCGSLPIGIVEEVTPCIVKKTLSDGDVFVMMSDGVADILDNEKVTAVLTSETSLNPNLIAKDLVGSALALGGREDDMSCVVGRIFRRAS